MKKNILISNNSIIQRVLALHFPHSLVMTSQQWQGY